MLSLAFPDSYLRANKSGLKADGLFVSFFFATNTKLDGYFIKR